MVTKDKDRHSRWDQPTQSHRLSASIPLQVRQPRVKAIPEVNTALSQAISSRSPTYSPPPALNATRPKTMLHPAERRREHSLRCNDPQYDGLKDSDHSLRHHSVPVAPWNRHQLVARAPPFDVQSVTEDEDSDEEPEGSSLGLIDFCDNYGCDASHSHDKCTLERRCRGCHSRNHFWTDCPMTCKECRSTRHIPKYCDDFQTPNSQGIAFPRYSHSRNPSLEPGQVEESPLPSKTMPTSRALIREQRKSPICSPVKDDRPLQRLEERPTIEPYRPPKNTDSYRPDKLSGRPQDLSSPDTILPERPPPSRILDFRHRDKEYCEYWLRTGRCSYMDTYLGCKYKHAIPNEQTLRHMGIHELPSEVKSRLGLQQAPLLRTPPTGPSSKGSTIKAKDTDSLQQSSKVRQAPRGTSNLQSTQAKQLPQGKPGLTQHQVKVHPQGPLSTQSSPSASLSVATSHLPKYSPSPPTGRGEKLPVLAESGHKIAKPVETDVFEAQQSANTRSGVRPSKSDKIDSSEEQRSYESPSEDHLANTPSTTQPSQPDRTVLAEEQGSLSAPNEDHPINITNATQIFNPEKLKAFEEEEFFKQKRHEAELKRKEQEQILLQKMALKRKAEEQDMEFKHELRMAKVRKGDIVE